MKKLFLFAAAAMMLAACTTDTTEDVAVNCLPYDVLHVSVGDDESRIQLDNGKTVWTQGDKVSVFYKTTGNECYQFTGNTGDTRGSIMKVSGSAGATAIDKNIVIYPYNKDYELDLMNNTVSVVIPSTQRYAKNSYGVGANVMIASSSNNQFTLRNICGWLKLQFTGNAIINAIKIKGNNNEQLAGTAIANYEDFSTFLYGNLANSGDDIGGIILPPGEYAREITLDCGTGLMLSDVPTEFYIAVAPQTLSKGISITAECYGNTSKIEKSTGKSITIARNHIVPVANIDIKADPRQCILYTSSDGKIVTPYDSSAFGASIVSNTYENGIGTIIFGKNITFIGKSAFQDCKSLTSVTIPNSVTSIGNSAFAGCNRLTAFHGKYASGDNRCLVQNGKLIAFAPAGLTEYTIPSSVTSIGNSAFYYCSNLTSITIPNSITGIESSAFKGCAGECIINCNIPDGSYNSNSGYHCDSAFKDSDFTKITIGNSVKFIGVYAFVGCRNLTSVTIGNNVTTIGGAAFYGCSGLTSITIPDCVTSIGNGAFMGCSSLTSVTIPDNVTSIGEHAFSYCSRLGSIYCKPTTPPTLGLNAFYNISTLAKIYVPRASVTSYKYASGWSSYASKITGYDFNEQSNE